MMGFATEDAAGGFVWREPDALTCGVLATEAPREIDTSALRVAGPAVEVEWASPVTELSWGDSA